MPRPKTKSKLTLSLPEAIINLKNDNTKPYKIAECLSSVTVTVTERNGTVQNGNGNGTVR